MLKIIRRNFNELYKPGDEFQTIKVEYKKELAVVTMNRPKKMNAMNTMMYTGNFIQLFQ